ncbi:S8/S53 family peptidase [Leptothrix discophora]|uniref:Uncharacterized protein n=1 Tax=Leptothrix discophora TaxID=89 RepID=A0ABT9G3K8_LEPDI|nr:hypothetical protein [Leptothrix discophora]MDP4301081.1 hypothetical protein [Leptothrix discophora]
MIAPDPYLRWAQLTQRRYLQPMRGPDGDWLKLVMTRDGAAALAGKTRRLVWSRANPDTDLATVWLHVDDLDLALAQSTRHRIGLAHPSLAPVVSARDAAARPGLVDMQGPAAPLAEVERCDAPRVIGVIDGRCGFLHQRFWRDGQPRIQRYWDQGAVADPASGLWHTPGDMGYGRAFTGADLHAQASSRLAAGLDAWQREQVELDLYRAFGHALPQACDWTHGTHILSTVLDAHDRARQDRSHKGEQDPGDPAVMHVQLPDLALLDTGANWLASSVLDGIDYILARCRPDAQVFINLSLGGFGGPQNGTSMLEQAIDDQIRAWTGLNGDRRLQVIVAAGNLGSGSVKDDGTGEAQRIHQRLKPDERNGFSFAWHVEIPDATETFVEFWVPALAGQPCAMRATLTPPHGSGAAPLTVEAGQQGELQVGGRRVAAVFNDTHTTDGANGSGASQVLVALAHTEDRDGRPIGPLGRWTLRLEVAPEQALPATVDGWMRRRDIPGELEGYRPQYGFAPSNLAVPDDLLDQRSSLANVHRGQVVGALEHPEDPPAAATLEEAGYSSTLVGGRPIYGPGRLQGPGFTTGTSKELRGTSIAAAHVCGALAGGTLPVKMALKVRGGGPAARGPVGAPPNTVDAIYIVDPP